MPKADLVLPDGTKVTIDGSTEEIAKLLATFAQPGRPDSRRAGGSRPKPGGTSAVKEARKGPSAHILELRDEGFFKTKRTLSDVQKKLEERGQIYAQTSLSPLMIGFVRKRALRRIKDGKRWAYVS